MSNSTKKSMIKTKYDKINVLWYISCKKNYMATEVDNEDTNMIKLTEANKISLLY